MPSTTTATQRPPLRSPGKPPPGLGFSILLTAISSLALHALAYISLVKYVGNAPKPIPLTEGLPLKTIILSFMIVVSVFELFLDFRQRRVLLRKELPDALVGVFSTESFLKARAYSLDKNTVGIIRFVLNTVLGSLVLWYNLIPMVWELAGRLIGTDDWIRWEVMQSIAFLGLAIVWETVNGIPWGILSTFIVEARHGFNNETVVIFITDIIKSLMLAFMFVPPIALVAIKIVRHSGPYFALFLWAFMCAISLLMVTIYPTLIAPLFNKFTPLEDGELRTKIEALAASLKFPLTKLFVVDGSTRSAHSNAYMYGFGNNKRIVLYDTLISQTESAEDVVAVIAHELGHWKLKHTVILLVSAQVLLVAQLLGYGLIANSPSVFSAFGFPCCPVILGLVLFSYLSGPVDHVISFGQNAVSRHFEFAADAFAQSLGHSAHLRNALIKLQEENKSAMVVDPYYSAYHYSHPPLVERLAALEKADKKKE